MNGQPSPNPRGNPPPAAPRLLGRLLDAVKNRATETVAVALIAAVGTAFYWSWGYVQIWSKDFIINTVAEELAKEPNKFIGPVKTMLARLRSSEIGALSVGNFVLTPNNPQYVLPIYMPKGHTGRLLITLSGYLALQKFYVRLALPTGKNIDITTKETEIDLAKYFKIASAADVDPTEGIVLRPEYIKGLRTLTFQLVQRITPGAADSATGAKKVEREIRVRYLALVSPTIKMSGTP